MSFGPRLVFVFGATHDVVAVGDVEVREHAELVVLSGKACGLGMRLDMLFSMRFGIWLDMW